MAIPLYITPIITIHLHTLYKYSTTGSLHVCFHSSCSNLHFYQPESFSSSPTPALALTMFCFCKWGLMSGFSILFQLSVSIFINLNSLCCLGYHSFCFSFSFLIILAGTSSTICTYMKRMNSFVLFLVLLELPWVFLHLILILTLGLHQIAFIIFRYFPCISNFSKIFIMGVCWIL